MSEQKTAAQLWAELEAAKARLLELRTTRMRLEQQMKMVRDRKYSAWLWLKGQSGDAEAEATCPYGRADVYSAKMRASVEVGNTPADRIFAAMAAEHEWLMVWPLWADALPIKFSFTRAGIARVRHENQVRDEIVNEMIRSRFPASLPTQGVRG